MSSPRNRKRGNPSPPAHIPTKIQKQDDSTVDDDKGTQASVEDMELEFPSQQAATPLNNTIEHSKVYKAVCTVWEDLVGHKVNDDRTIKYIGCNTGFGYFCKHYVWTFIHNLRSVCGIDGDDPVERQMKFACIRNILKLSDADSGFGKRKWEKHYRK